MYINDKRCQGKNMARPRKEIDQAEFEKLCALQCTQQEICDWFRIVHDTLDRWCYEIYEESFSQVFAQKRGIGKASLRRNQWKLSEKNPSMAIFLGKNYLEQSDKQEHEIKLPDNKLTIEVVHNS